MKYVLNIEFEGNKHCLHCPIRDQSGDSCRLQPESNDFDSWEEQLENCPLKLAK